MQFIIRVRSDVEWIKKQCNKGGRIECGELQVKGEVR